MTLLVWVWACLYLWCTGTAAALDLTGWVPVCRVVT
jgi:hypothetical protein